MPQALRDLVRAQTYKPEDSHESAVSVVNDIVTALHGLSERIRSTGANGFWNVVYEGNAIVGRLPKKETDVHQTLHLLLEDSMFMKNMKIIPEPRVGRGNLDFLVTAPLRAGGLAHICVECKQMHSDDIGNGPRHQLPEYMERVGTDHGIYLVLSYGEGYRFSRAALENHFPGYYNRSMPDDAMLVGAAAKMPGIRLFILDMSPGKVPSARRGHG